MAWSVLLLTATVIVVYLQYRRITAMETELYGLAKHQALKQTVHSMLLGAVGGGLGSVMLTVAGVGLVETSGSASALFYLWPVSILLGFVNSRYICIAYSATLVALSKLMFGWPQIDIPSVTALVAILHMVECILVRLGGSVGAMALSVPGDREEPIPGFRLQRFWPVPLVLPIFSHHVVSPVDMPSWWPIVHTDPSFASTGEMGWMLVPVVVIMGYADLAISEPPGQRIRVSSRMLLLYSLLLLALSIGAGWYRPLMWVAALFSGLGHEAMALWSGRSQLAGKPYLMRPKSGVAIFDVLPNTPAAKGGLRSGTIILSVDDFAVHSREELHQALMAAQSEVQLVCCIGEQVERCRVPQPAEGIYGFGAILLPEPGDRPLSVDRPPALLRWATRK